MILTLLKRIRNPFKLAAGEMKTRRKWNRIKSKFTIRTLQERSFAYPKHSLRFFRITRIWKFVEHPKMNGFWIGHRPFLNYSQTFSHSVSIAQNSAFIPFFYLLLIFYMSFPYFPFFIHPLFTLSDCMCCSLSLLLKTSHWIKKNVWLRVSECLDRILNLSFCVLYIQ